MKYLIKVSQMKASKDDINIFVAPYEKIPALNLKAVEYIKRMILFEHPDWQMLRPGDILNPYIIYYEIAIYKGKDFVSSEYYYKMKRLE